MIHTLAVVTFAQLLSYQPPHHDLHPLFPDDGVLRLLQSLVVVVVDAVEGGRDGRLLGQEGFGFGSRHCDRTEMLVI